MNEAQEGKGWRVREGYAELVGGITAWDGDAG
jgi:hypothetical protein